MAVKKEKIEMKPGSRMLRVNLFGEHTSDTGEMHYFIRIDLWSVGWRWSWKPRPLKHKMGDRIRSPWWR
jgi:hypothetical protein